MNLSTWHVEIESDDLLWRCAIEVVGEYHKGDHYLVTPITITPPDPECVDIHHVYLVYDSDVTKLYQNAKEKPRVDIISILTQQQIDDLERRILNEINSEDS